jgi:hypothetical protein
VYPTSVPSIQFDTSRFPLVIVRFPAFALSLRDIDTFAAGLDQLHARGERLILVVDVLGVHASLGGAERKAMTRLMLDDERRKATKQARVVDVILIDSAIVRGALAVVHMVAPLAVPTKAVTRARDALAFVEEHCREARFALTPALRAWFQTH